MLILFSIESTSPTPYPLAIWTPIYSLLRNDNPFPQLMREFMMSGDLRWIGNYRKEVQYYLCSWFYFYVYYAGHEIWTDTIGKREFTVGFFFEWCMTEVKNNITEKYGGIFFLDWKYKIYSCVEILPKYSLLVTYF